MSRVVTSGLIQDVTLDDDDPWVSRPSYSASHRIESKYGAQLQLRGPKGPSSTLPMTPVKRPEVHGGAGWSILPTLS
jgi:hypothetical protein